MEAQEEVVWGRAHHRFKGTQVLAGKITHQALEGRRHYMRETRGGMFQKLGRTTERLEDRTSENDILVFKMWKKLDSVTLFLSKSL